MKIWDMLTNILEKNSDYEELSGILIHKTRFWLKPFRSANKNEFINLSNCSDVNDNLPVKVFMNV